jgi:hypothetical protein
LPTIITAFVAPIKIAPTMTLMEYTVTPTAETLKRTRKTIKINTKNTLDLYDDNQTPEVFTDIDNYNDYNLDNDQENYPGWGSNPQGVSINIMILDGQ